VHVAAFLHATKYISPMKDYSNQNM